MRITAIFTTCWFYLFCSDNDLRFCHVEFDGTVKLTRITFPSYWCLFVLVMVICLWPIDLSYATCPADVFDFSLWFTGLLANAKSRDNVLGHLKCLLWSIDGLTDRSVNRYPTNTFDWPTRLSVDQLFLIWFSHSCQYVCVCFYFVYTRPSTYNEKAKVKGNKETTNTIASGLHVIVSKFGLITVITRIELGQLGQTLVHFILNF